MKKRDLWAGIGMMIAGILFLLAALMLDTPLGGLFCGFFGALCGPGVAQVLKYRKWSRPENVPVYQELLEQERINLRDERNSMLRDRSGRYAYLFGLAVLTAAVLVFSILEMLGVLSITEGRLITLFLAGHLIVLYLAGFVFYYLLERKY